MNLRLVPQPEPGELTARDARIRGDVEKDRELFVVVGDLGFRFWRESESPDWIGFESIAIHAGAHVTLASFLRAQTLAIEAMSSAVRGQRAVLRCPDCERILSTEEVEALRNAAEPDEISCGVPHLLTFGNRTAVV